MQSNDPATSNWHLDKRIPIALIVTLALNTIGFFISGAYVVAKFDARISFVENFATDNKETKERLAVIEVQLKNLTATMSRVEDKLDEGTK